MKNNKIKEYALMTLGILLLAIGLQYFFFPNNIVAGGLSGLSLLINKLTGLSPGIAMLSCNVLLFIFAFMLMGGNFGAKSIYSAFGLSIILWAMEKFLPKFSFTNNLILATIFGAIIAALGIAIVFNQDSSTGGTTIIAKIINKYFHIDIGKCQLFTDFVVTILAFKVFGIEQGLLGLLGVFLMGILIDKFIDGFTLCKQVIIITSKGEEIEKIIINEISRGCTALEGRGVYSKEKNSVLFVVVSRKEFLELKKKLKSVDPDAFITVTDSKEVFGKGFADLLEI
ncbi:YitT family protein [Clostridium hydrogeniformans]|uniref:YitT family protein n=1 Tax=Clostridium hydrogeniformans TaxID=349933 RepID=UPI0004810CF1|nr:YitT family protein [Clostridium hydrogeniformans]